MFNNTRVINKLVEALLKLKSSIRKNILKKNDTIDIHKQVAILNKQIHKELTNIELVLTNKYRMTFDKRQEELEFLKKEAGIIIKTFYPELLGKNALIERYQWYVNYYQNELQTIKTANLVNVTVTI